MRKGRGQPAVLQPVPAIMPESQSNAAAAKRYIQLPPLTLISCPVM